MASPPTVTLTASSAITGGTTYAYNDPNIRYLGTLSNTTLLPGNALAGHVDYNTYRSGPIQQVEFYCDAANLEILTLNTGNKYRLFVNDQAVSLTPGTLGSTSYAGAYLTVTFSSAAPRRIRFETEGFGAFGGVKVPNNYGVWLTPANPIRGMIVGDSYSFGSNGDGTDNPHLGLGRQAGFLLGVRDWWVSAMPGEGYIQNGNQSGKALRARSATDIVPYAPDWLVFCEGINFGTGVAATAQAEVTTLYSGLMAALPNTVFTVIGPFRAPSQNPSTAYANGIKAGVQAVPGYGTRLQYFDTYADNWQQVAGKVGAVSGSGNSNLYIGADGVHPVPAGHDYLASRVANTVLHHAQSILAS
jgi:lysophospholipase L1-like esterase